MEQFQIKDKRKYLSIRNSPIKLGIDINNVLPALNLHTSRYRKLGELNYVTLQYTVGCKRILDPNTTTKVSLSHPSGVHDNLRPDGIPRDIYLFGPMNKPYIIVIIECLYTTRNAGDIIVKESGSIMLAIFKVDTLDKSKKVITDISPHGLMPPVTSGYNICGCIYSTCECTVCTGL